MSTPTPAGTEPEGSSLQPPTFRQPPSPSLPARAGRGYARFLTLHALDDSMADHGQGDVVRHR